MSAGAVARRYAAALFDVTRDARTRERAGRDLSALAEAVAGHADLSYVLASPAIAPAAKRTIVTRVLDAAGDLTPEVRRIVLLLAERGRLGALGEVAEAFADRLREERREVRAEVVTAIALPPAARAALGDALAKATGRQVTLTERVDPSIVGGLVARVGSVVYDGSVTRQLERLRERLAGD
jgi:F-type H+-transporting ATPase subunit delta